MAKDDIDPEELEGLEIEEADPEILDDLEEGEFLEEDADEEEPDLVEDDAVGIEETAGKTKPRKGAEDEDDEDLVAPDDVEEDLAEILKDRLAAEDQPAEDEETEEWDEKATGEDALQPKRADEVMCTSCFLLVRKAAPTCPVGDEGCPIFSAPTGRK